MSQAIDTSFAGYAAFTVLLAATPGSTTAVVVRNALERGRGSGLATALGAALANTICATLAGLGMSAEVTAFPGAVQAARLLGAAYLAWLGAASLANAWRYADGGISFTGSPSRGACDRSGGPATGFRDGLAVNLLNPTVISFYVAVVPSFVPSGAPIRSFTLLAATHVSIALACHSAWAATFGELRRWFLSPGSRRALEACTGLALVALAARVMMTWGGQPPDPGPP